MVIASLWRVGSEQRLAVVTAEQEREPVQVLAQLRHGACPLSMRAWEPPECLASKCLARPKEPEGARPALLGV